MSWAYDVGSDKQNDLIYVYILQKVIFWVLESLKILLLKYLIICHDQEAETPREKAISQGIIIAIIIYYIIESLSSVELCFTLLLHNVAKYHLESKLNFWISALIDVVCNFNAFVGKINRYLVICSIKAKNYNAN